MNDNIYNIISQSSLGMKKRYSYSPHILIIKSSLILGLLFDFIPIFSKSNHKVLAEGISTSVTIDSDVLRELTSNSGDLRLIKGNSQSSELIIKAKSDESIDLSNLKFKSLNSLILTTGSSLGGVISVNLNESQISEIEKVSATEADSLTINTSNTGSNALKGKVIGKNIVVNINNDSNIDNTNNSFDFNLASVENYLFTSIPKIEAKSNFLSRVESSKNDVFKALNLKNTLANNNSISSLQTSLVNARSKITSNKDIKSSYFLQEKYNPAILHLDLTFAKDKTIDQSKDAYLDITLILPENDIVGKRVELSTSNFKKYLRNLYSTLISQNDLNIDNPNSPSRKLYELFLSKIEPILKENKITTLLISVDRGLQAVPFAALNNGNSFFGEKYSYAITPSLSLTPLEYVRNPKGKLLALGASNFKNLSNLNFVEQELKNIQSLNQKDVYFNDLFTPKSLINNGSSSDYDRIHIASHAEFLPGDPTNSLIHTTNDVISMKNLSEFRIKRKDLPIDLFVLSACRTAIGDSQTELGFSGLALQASARSAIGTLWYIDDIVTSAYFVQLYDFLNQRIPKADAIRLTRSAFINKNIRVENDSILGVNGKVLVSNLQTNEIQNLGSSLNNPYFWAGIQIMGSPW